MMDAATLARAAPTPTRAKNIAALVGEAGWARLPAAVRARFGGAAMQTQFIGEGVFAANWLGRLFAAFGVVFGQPLPLRRGRADLFIRVTPTKVGEVWTRVYSFGDGDEIVRSVKHAGRGAWLEERAGPLIMRLAVFEENSALVFQCLDFLLRFGALEIAVPLPLTPGRIRVEHTDKSDGRFAFTLTADHPWLGRTFHQVCHLQDAGARHE